MLEYGASAILFSLFFAHCPYNFLPQGDFASDPSENCLAPKLQPPGNTGSVAASDVQRSAHNKKIALEMERALKVQTVGDGQGIV